MRFLRQTFAACLLSVCAASAGANDVPPPAERLVVAGGEIVEIIYALGAQQLLVGVDSTSIFPPEARALPQIGYLRTLPVEGILSLRPDRILVTQDAGPATALNLLSQRVPVTRIETTLTPQGVIERVRLIAQIVGRQQAGDELIQRLQREFAEVSTYLPVVQPPRVLILLAITREILLVGGRDTAAQALLDTMGLPNAATVSGFIPFSAEAFLSLQPDVLLIAETEPGLFRMGDWPALQVMPAVRNGRVLTVDSIYALTFGPRLPRIMAEVLTFVTGRPVALSTQTTPPTTAPQQVIPAGPP